MKNPEQDFRGDNGFYILERMLNGVYFENGQFTLVYLVLVARFLSLRLI